MSELPQKPDQPQTPPVTPPPDAGAQLQIRMLKIVQWHRSARYLLLIGGALTAVVYICNTIVKVAGHIETMVFWVSLAAVSLGGCGVLKVLFTRIRRHTTVDHQRILRLEEQADPGRSTSGLRKDGSKDPLDPTA